jgi:hypothetical protein
METLNKYNNASIYTIRNRADDSLIYVGSTIGAIHKRLSVHKSSCKMGKSGSLYSHIINNDWTDWYIELYEKVNCNSREELCRREGQVIRDIGTINKCIAGSTHKESVARYYTANREKVNEKCARCYCKKIRENEEFYAAEKERIKAYKKHRYNTDPEYREKIIQRVKENYNRKKAVTLNTAN